MHQVSSLKLKDYIDCQKRPRTGRGSQGGRRWRSSGTDIFKKKSSDEHTSENHLKKEKQDNASIFVTSAEKSGKSIQNHVLHPTSEMLYSQQNTDACHQVRNHAIIASEETFDNSSFGTCEIAPLHILNNVHQSGVNCLHVSDVKNLNVSEGRSTHYVLSGGDDQALNCLRLDLTRKAVSHNYQGLDNEGCSASLLQNMNSCIHTCQVQNYFMRFLSVDKIPSAHSSAVKGMS